MQRARQYNRAELLHVVSAMLVIDLGRNKVMIMTMTVASAQPDLDEAVDMVDYESCMKLCCQYCNNIAPQQPTPRSRCNKYMRVAIAPAIGGRRFAFACKHTVLSAIHFAISLWLPDGRNLLLHIWITSSERSSSRRVRIICPTDIIDGS